MNPRITSAVSALAAAAVPAADAAFGWHLPTAPVALVVVGLLGLAAVELGHANVSAKSKDPLASAFESILGGLTELLGEKKAAASTPPANEKAS